MRKQNGANKKKSAKYIQDELQDHHEFSTQHLPSDLITFKNFKPTPKQELAINIIKQNKITTITGPPGTAKSTVACYTALHMLKNKEIKKIIFIKPTEIVGGTEIGFLPGTLADKLSVFLDSFISNLNDIILEKDTHALFENKTIEFKPVQFIRGCTFNNAVIIVDEFQSFDIKALMAIVTRLGRYNSKMIFLGDTEQNDINKKYVAIDFFKDVLNGIKSTGAFQFDRNDIMRDKILIDIIDNYEKLKAENKLPQTKGNT